MVGKSKWRGEFGKLYPTNVSMKTPEMFVGDWRSSRISELVVSDGCLTECSGVAVGV